MDRNKTTLTHDVTAAAAQWMDARGFKPVESEVPVTNRWVADLAGVIHPTQTELIDLKLLSRSPRWDYRNPDHCRQQEWQRKRDELYRSTTCLVEVKTSRADYRGDRKWLVAQPTDLAYVAVPAGMVRPDEWPNGWGVLEVKDGQTRCLRPPTVRRTSTEQQRDVILAIAVRRDHHTRYERHREWQKQQRIEDNERKSADRMDDVARFVLSVVRAEYPSFEETLARSYRIRRDMPTHILEKVAALHGVHPLTPEEIEAEDLALAQRRRELQESAARRKAKRAA